MYDRGRRPAPPPQAEPVAAATAKELGAATRAEFPILHQEVGVQSRAVVLLSTV